MKNGENITVSFVRGSEGISFQIGGDSYGIRVAGPKARGNVYNKPFVEMTFPVQDLYDALIGNWPELLSPHQPSLPKD